MNEEYLKGVFQMLASGPAPEDIPKLIEAYTRVGHLLAEARAEADDAANIRKHEEAQEFLKAKAGKVSDAMAEKVALVAVFGLRRLEIAAERKVKKIAFLRESIYEALHMLRAGTIDAGL